MKNWKKLSHEYLLKTKWLSLRKDSYETPEGKIIDDFYIVERPNVVVIVPQTSEGKFVLVRQYRHGIEEIVLNFPMGFIDSGEEPRSAAKRELFEETGFHADTIKFLGKFFLTPSFTKISAHIFSAENLSAQETNHEKSDTDEISEIVFVSRLELEDLIAREKFSGLTSICAYLLTKKPFTEAGG